MKVKNKTKQSFFACFLATAKTFVSSVEIAIKTFFFPTKSGMHRNGIFSWKRSLHLCIFLAEQVLWPRQNWHPRFSLLVKINYQPHGHSSLKYWNIWNFYPNFFLISYYVPLRLFWKFSWIYPISLLVPLCFGSIPNHLNRNNSFLFHSENRSFAQIQSSLWPIFMWVVRIEGHMYI